MKLELGQARLAEGHGGVIDDGWTTKLTLAVGAADGGWIVFETGWYPRK